jgi:hypothetical protein
MAKHPIAHYLEKTLEIYEEIGTPELITEKFTGPDGRVDYVACKGALAGQLESVVGSIRRAIELYGTQPTPTEGRTADEVLGPLRQLEHPRVAETELEARRQEESRAALEEAEATRNLELYGI